MTGGAAGQPPVWTAEQVQQAAALHGQGLSQDRIAAQLGLTRATTRRLLVRAGVLAPATEETVRARQDQLRRLVAELRQGLPLAAAARAAEVDLQAARALLRSARELITAPLTPALQEQAARVREHLVDDDLRLAARELGMDPWWAMFLLVATGSASVSMVQRRSPQVRARVARMAARRAEGASYDVLAAEFGLHRERVRQYLLEEGGWTPRLRRYSPRSIAPTSEPPSPSVQDA